MDSALDSRHPQEELHVGTRVDVHTRYEPGRWASGFTIAAVCPNGYLIRRASDGAILSETIHRDELRVVSTATPPPGSVWQPPREGDLGSPSSFSLAPETGSRPRATTDRALTASMTSSRRRHRPIPKASTDQARLPPDVLVLESCHSTWIFDPLHLQLRRILKGVGVGNRSVMTAWRAYWQVELDFEGEGFTVYLNSSRSRLIRSWRHTQNCSQCGGSDTAELSLEDIYLTLQGIAVDTRERSSSQ